MTFVSACTIGMCHEYSDFVDLMDLKGRYQGMKNGGFSHLFLTVSRFFQAIACFAVVIFLDIQFDFSILESDGFSELPFHQRWLYNTLFN